MKVSLPLMGIVALAVTSSVQAFPSKLRELANIDNTDPKFDTPIRRAFREKVAAMRRGEPLLEKRAPRENENEEYPRRLFSLLNPESFDYNEQDQYVDLTDAHPFIPPGPGDIRGPCPGLNLLANHGYLPRNGITTLAQATDAIQRVFGVEADLALALNAYAVVFNGNLLDTTWSIGGPYTPSGLLGGVLGLLGGEPSGINAHNVYEGDASIVRQDLYEPGKGNNVDVDLTLYQELLDLGRNDQTPEKDVYTSDLMIEHKIQRKRQSIANNPLYFQSPFGGLVVTLAAERFVAEFAANNTRADNGKNRIYLDEENLNAFFGVTREKDGSLTYKRGHERLLPSWHRRPLAAQFGLDDIVITLLSSAAKDPSLLTVGGNAGKVNTFAGVDVGDLTGGVFHLADLLENPPALACYLFQVFESAAPTFLGSIYRVVGNALDYLFNGFGKPLQQLATSTGNPCLTLKVDLEKQYAKFPGSKTK